MQEIKKKLQEKKHRLTKSRIELINFFVNHDNQLFTIEEIINELSVENNVNIATVYNNISTLLDSNIINELVYNNKKYYEYSTNNHGHFFCNSCHNVFNVDIKGLNCLHYEIKQKYGANVLKNIIEFKGVCCECQKKL